MFGVNVFKTLMLVAKTPTKTAQDIANELNVSKRTIENYFAKLKSNNYIKRIGSDKTGSWETILKKDRY
jgi:cell filamentation protein, protein adenylyltransferase